MIGGPRLWLIAAAVVASIGFILWQRHDARQDVIDQIEEQNDDAGDAADAADLGLIECQSRDGMFWDFAAGVCRRSEPGGG